MMMSGVPLVDGWYVDWGKVPLKIDTFVLRQARWATRANRTVRKA